MFRYLWLFSSHCPNCCCWEYPYNETAFVKHDDDRCGAKQGISKVSSDGSDGIVTFYGTSIKECIEVRWKARKHDTASSFQEESNGSMKRLVLRAGPRACVWRIDALGFTPVAKNYNNPYCHQFPRYRYHHEDYCRLCCSSCLYSSILPSCLYSRSYCHQVADIRRTSGRRRRWSGLELGGNVWHVSRIFDPVVTLVLWCVLCKVNC